MKQASRWMVVGSMLAASLIAPQAYAQALNILLTNDDGFETALIRALQQELEAAGHDVLVSAPTQNQSGRGGSMDFLQPLAALSRDTRFGSVEAGESPVGEDPSDPDVRYVAGTPVMAMLYGLDVVAPERWDGQPDLVISGPNDGNNLGAINNSSGTVNAALYGINRGLPAIAVSYEVHGARSWTDLAPGDDEYLVAGLVVDLLDAVIQGAGEGQPLLPAGVGLNVNIPDLETLEADALPYRVARMSSGTTFWPVFFERLADSDVAVGSGAGAEAPGISFAVFGGEPPDGVVIPADDDPRAERSVMLSDAISVSVIEGLARARRSNEELVRIQLGELLESQ